MSDWPDPDKPGVPLNPERDGWHWLLQPVTEKQWIIAWNPDWNYWGAFPGISPNDMGHPKLRGYKYLGPVLMPAEVDALRAENARLREALQHAEAAMDSLMSDEMPYTESCRIWRTAAESIRAALEVKP
jgi:hypothetical protein